MTDDEIKAARALCEAATPGPWDELAHFGLPLSRIVDVTCEPGCIGFADAAFIAASRTLVPRLLDEVERLRSALAEAVDALNDVNPDYSRDEWERLANRLAALKSNGAP